MPKTYTTDTYTTKEAADRLGIEYSAMDKRLRRANITPHHTIGRMKFWTAAQVDRLKRTSDVSDSEQ